MHLQQEIPAVILAGGQSTRMGSRKALTDIGGVPLIERVVRQLENRFFPLFVSVKEPFDIPEGIRLNTIEDTDDHRTPIAGISAALGSFCEMSLGPWVMVTTCDLLFYPPALSDILIERASSMSSGAVVFQDQVGVAPFPGLYHCETYRYWRQALHNQTFRLQQVLSALPSLQIIPAGETQRRFPGWSLNNINTPGQLELCLEKLSKGACYDPDDLL